MRIMFLGTPEIAATHLKKLLDDKKDIVAVVTREDKPRGRGNVMTPTPVKSLALEYSIPVYTPKTLRGGRLLQTMLLFLWQALFFSAFA